MSKGISSHYIGLWEHCNRIQRIKLMYFLIVAKYFTAPVGIIFILKLTYL